MILYGLISFLGFSSTGPEPLSTRQTIKFDDVQGVDEAKDELMEIVEFLRNPKKFTEVGGKLPKGSISFFDVNDINNG